MLIWIMNENIYNELELISSNELKYVKWNGVNEWKYF